MLVTNKPFLSLTAADLMTDPVLTIPEETSLRAAARLLCRSHISGAPVVDAQGRCVGVLSSSDFVVWAGKQGEETAGAPEATAFIAPWGETVVIEDAPDKMLREYMTVRPVTVTAQTPIGDMAQKMVDAHIHRVLVVLAGDQPCGIVTSTDILAAVAHEAQRAAEHKETKPARRNPTRRQR
jgi:CBS domain-containing protein